MAYVEGLTLTVVSPTRVDLSWVEVGGPSTVAQVERSLDNVTWAPLSLVYYGLAVYSDTACNPETSYWYRIRLYEPISDWGPYCASICTMTTELLVTASGVEVVVPTEIFACVFTPHDIHLLGLAAYETVVPIEGFAKALTPWDHLTVPPLVEVTTPIESLVTAKRHPIAPLVLTDVCVPIESVASYNELDLTIADSVNNRTKIHSSLTLGYASQIALAAGLGPYHACSDALNTYVSCSTTHQVKKYLKSTGALLWTIGGTGYATDKFKNPQGIWTDGTHVYVVDKGNFRIKKHLCSTGAYVSMLPTTGIVGNYCIAGNGLGEFREPYGLDSDGVNLYISEAKPTVASGPTLGIVNQPTAQTQTFMTTPLSYFGVHVGRLYGKGICNDGTYYYSTHCTTSGGTSWVSVRKTRITNGELIWDLTSKGSGDGQFWQPKGIATDSTHIYIIDGYLSGYGTTTRLKKHLCSTGAFVSSVVLPSLQPRGICIYDGHLYVVHGNVTAGSMYLSKHRATDLFTEAAKYWPASPVGGPTDTYLTSICTDEAHLFLGNENTGATVNKIFEHNLDLSFVATHLQPGSTDPKVYAVTGLATDKTNLYVLQTYTIKTFLIADWSFVSKWAPGTSPYNGSYLYYATGICYNATPIPQPYVRVHTCAALAPVQQLSEDVNIATANCQAIAVDNTYLYLVNKDNAALPSVFRYTKALAFVNSFGTFGAGDAQFSSPQGVATNGRDLYISDTGNNRIKRHTIAGAYLAQIGSIGAGNAQFSTPIGISGRAIADVMMVSAQVLLLSDQVIPTESFAYVQQGEEIINGPDTLLAWDADRQMREFATSNPWSYWDTKDIDFGFPGVEKTAAKIVFWGKPSVPIAVTVSISVDGGISWIWSETVAIDRATTGIVHPWVTGERFRIRFEANGLALSGFHFTAVPRGQEGPTSD